MDNVYYAGSHGLDIAAPLQSPNLEIPSIKLELLTERWTPLSFNEITFDDRFQLQVIFIKKLLFQEARFLEVPGLAAFSVDKTFYE